MMTLLESPEQTTSISSDTKCHSPSLFLVKIAMKINKLDNNLPIDRKSTDVKECERFGEALGNSIWRSRKDIEEHHEKLENPASLGEYYANFPSTLISFFEGLVGSIEKQRCAVRERKYRQREKKELKLDMVAVKKITVFFASIILTITFKSWNIWLTRTMA